MIQAFSKVTKISEVASETYLLELVNPTISRSAVPGQFINIRVHSRYYPLLRRPMSICDIEGENVKILFNVVGLGTSILARTRVGNAIDVIGPLGRGFDLTADFDLAIIVSGGLGVAPFPFLTRELAKRNRPVVSFVGAKNTKHLVTAGLQKVYAATDDGSEGYRGTVIELLRFRLPELKPTRAMIFACGPTEMLRALQAYVRETFLPTEASLETPMACGLGICQGCPVEMADASDSAGSLQRAAGNSQKYKLSCKDGPVFDLSKIVI